MTAAELIAELRARRIEMWFEEGIRLRYRAPKGALTPDLRDELARLKPELIALLPPAGAPVSEEISQLRPASCTGDSGPLSFGQRRLWFFEQLQPGTNVFNVPFSIRIEGALDASALQHALDDLLATHEILRTRFEALDGVPRQVIVPNVQMNVSRIDLAGMTEVERRSSFDRLVGDIAGAVFKLDCAPLLRATLVRISSSEHVLVMCAHHIVCDGSSLAVIVKNLAALYRARVEGGPLGTRLPIQYRDFALWQQKVLAGPERDRHLAYWRDRLSGPIAPLELPTDAPRPPIQTYPGECLSATVDETLTSELKTIARQSSATLFMVLLTAFQVLLARLSGQRDVIVGTPVAGRTRSETESLIGMFINTVPVRTSVDPDRPFIELLRDVRGAALQAFEHQDLPFEQIVEELQPARDLSRPPVFQALFNMMNAEVQTGISAAGVRFSMQGGSELSSKFDLTLYAIAHKDHVQLMLLYNSDLFRAPRMREMLSEFEQLLRHIVQAPSTPVGALSLLGPGVPSALPDPAVPLHSLWQGSILDRLREHARRTPAALAVVDSRQSISYEQLNDRSERVASWLSTRGIGPGSVVALYAHRQANLVVALLGVIKSGSAFLLLDPAHPAKRTAECLAAARPKAWIRFEAAIGPQENVLTLVRETCACELTWPSVGLPPEVESSVDRAPAVPIDPDAPAYIAFTSGSTGGVKGIVGTHRPLSHFVEWHARQFELTSTDRFSLLSGLSHDPLLRDVLTPLHVGGTLIVPDAERLQEPGWLARWMTDQRISVTHLTPAMAELLLIERGPGGVSLRELEHVFLAGEVLQTRLVERLRAAAPCAQYVNFYGATETPQAMGWNVVEPQRDGERPGRDTVPVGRGIDDVQLLVLNDAQQLAAIGELGEICIRTPYLALGYLNDERLTASRFVSNPFTGVAADRIYRTGDLGRYLPDGRVEFAGRRDLQVKIRGFRVELEAVEAAIREHPDVEAAIVTLGTESGEPRLTGYVKWRRQPAPDGELNEFLRARLPDYMIPVVFGVLDAVPLTPNGKIDRRALPDLRQVTVKARERVAPQSVTETALAQIWSDVLAVRDIGRDDEFFALGGHSLAVARLIARIDKVLGVQLPLRAVFEAPSLRALAARIDAGGEAARPRRPLLERVARTGSLPLSFAQERLWFLQQLLPGSSAYHMAAVAKLTGHLDTDSFRRAWDLVSSRHEAFRTRIRQRGGEPFVELSETPLLEYVELDLSPAGEDEAVAEALMRFRELVDRPFDLEAGPLVRVLLARVGERAFVHGVALHHIIADHWSIGPLTRDLAAAYESTASGRDPAWSPLRVQYVDYAAWQRTVLDEQEMSRQLGFWKTRLEGLEPLELPFDRPRPSTGIYRGARVVMPIPAATFAALEELTRSEGVTLFMALLAGFDVLLQRYTGRRDIAVGSPVTNRGHVDLEPIVGMFVNMLVLRADLSGPVTARELLRRVRAMALDAYAHQDFPFERLVTELRVARDVSQPPLVQVAFNVQNAPIEREFIQGIALEPLPIERTSTQFDLSLAIEPEITRTITAEYSSELFDASTIHRMLGHYVRLLEAMAKAPDAPIATLPMLSDDEHGELVTRWNKTSAEYPRNAPVTALLSATAAAVPDKVAVVGAGEHLTYSELEWRASWLAQHLKQQGAGRNVPIAVCLERSPRLLVSLLGVLKAGAAYVPLDPGFPRERLSFMIRDAEVPIILSAGDAIDGLEVGHATVVDLDQCWSAMTEGPAPACEATGEDLAYIIYTSGSTGVPKGVKIPHRALVNFLCSMRERPGLQAEDVLLSVTTPSFDIFGLEAYLPLLAGAKLVMATADEASDGARLVELLDEHGITIMQATPATWRIMIDAGWSASPGLRVLCGGEALPRELANLLLERTAAVWNMYGPTETTIWSAVDEVSGSSPITIGYPIANTDLLVLDEHLQPAPVGVPGEIFIGGEGLAAGYLNRPELDVEKFVNHPFAGAGARLYRTGDRGRRLADGRVECLGRSDQQVKVRGFRIELGEIESVLNRHDAIRQSVASVYDDGAGDRRLVAYVSFRPGQDLTASEMRRYARQHLPDYMVPSLFVVLDEIPLTANGKVNRKALPPPVAASRERATRVAPRTAMEQTVAAVWMEVLNIREVGVHDNFFDIGGHSLLSMQAIARLEKQVGVRLNPTRFIMDTLEQVSLACEELVAKAGSAPIAVGGGSGASAAGRS